MSFSDKISIEKLNFSENSSEKDTEETKSNEYSEEEIVRLLESFDFNEKKPIVKMFERKSKFNLKGEKKSNLKDPKKSTRTSKHISFNQKVQFKEVENWKEINKIASNPLFEEPICKICNIM